MKTRIVTFSYGTIKNAKLDIPAEAHSVVDIVNLIRQSYLDYVFGSRNCIFSDECATSSIGQSNFFAGALGGYKTRLEPKVFEAVESMTNHLPGLALAVARRRDPSLTEAQVYARAAKNDALSATDRAFLAKVAESYAATAES